LTWAKAARDWTYLEQTIPVAKAQKFSLTRYFGSSALSFSCNVLKNEVNDGS
jgi:hypothetical protein